MLKPLSDIQRRPLDVVLGGIAANDEHTSASAGIRLVKEAGEYGLNVRDYLTLAVDVPGSTRELAGGRHVNPYMVGEGQFMSGYEAALKHLNLPVRNDFKAGVVLQAAADSFHFKPGTRALFPEVVDDMLQWATKQDAIETIDKLVAQSRTIKGNELITRAIFDDTGNRNTFTIAEFANIPVQTIQQTDKAVSFAKHGSGIRTSYEFQRRVSLDVLTPYATRIQRQLEISKVAAATHMLVNGDGVHSAAPVQAITTYGADLSGGKSLKDNYKALMAFLVKRAASLTPVDTLVGNLDMYLELFLMFQPTVSVQSLAEALQAKGAPRVGLTLPVMQDVNFVLSSAMPANMLLCYSKGDTLEELKEAGGAVSESETAIKNQSITYVKTETTGYRLVYGDTRTVLNVAG